MMTLDNLVSRLTIRRRDSVFERTAGPSPVIGIANEDEYGAPEGALPAMLVEALRAQSTASGEGRGRAGAGR